MLGRRDSICLRSSPWWFRGTRAFHELVERAVGMPGGKGSYELAQQPTLLCAGAQHPLAVAL